MKLQAALAMAWCFLGTMQLARSGAILQDMFRDGETFGLDNYNAAKDPEAECIDKGHNCGDSKALCGLPAATYLNKMCHKTCGVCKDGHNSGNGMRTPPPPAPIIEPTLVIEPPPEPADLMSFEEFRLKFKKRYTNEREYRKREAIFRQNREEVEAHNKLWYSGQSTFQMGINQFSDMTFEEFKNTMTGQVERR